MIFTERTITIRKGASKINEPVILYRGDYEVEVRFTIMDSKFRFLSGVNVIDSEKASYAQLAILTPYGGNIFSEVTKCNEGTVTFLISKTMLDQIEEVGLYSFQIRLFDYNKESRASIPPVEFGLEFREPITSEDHDNSVNNAIVGYSIAKIVDPKNEKVGPTFDGNGDYIETKWETGDRISEGKLNKIEDAIDTINQNEKNDIAALDKKITSNFNVLSSEIDATGGALSAEIDTVNGRISSVIAHAGDGTKDSEIVDARKGHTVLYDRLEQLEDGTLSLNSAVAHLWEIGDFNVTNDVLSNTQTYIRFKEPVKFDFPVRIQCGSEYEFAIGYKDAAGLVHGYESNFMTDFTVAPGRYFRLQLRKKTNRVALTQDQIGAFANLIQLTVVPSALVDHVIGNGEKIAVKTKVRNLFDKTKCIVGEVDGYYATNGNWQAHNGYVSSPFIPVEPGKLYRDRPLAEYIYIQVVFWDENFNKVNGGYATKRDDGFIFVPNDKNVKYLTIPIQKTNMDTKMVIEWDGTLEDFPTEYIPYSEEKQIADEHLLDVYDAINEVQLDLNVTKGMLTSNNPDSILVAPTFDSTYRPLEEGEYVMEDGGISIYNLWSKESEDIEATSYWGHFITEVPKGTIFLGAGCLVVGYKPDSGTVYAYNGSQQFHALTTSGSTKNIITTDLEGFFETTPSLKNLLLEVDMNGRKLTYSNPETKTSFSITLEQLREFSGDDTALLCWGETAYIHVISVYPKGALLATLTPGIDTSGVVKAQLETEVARLDNRIDNIAMSGGAGSHWNGKTWYAYGTSITSIAQGNYVPYVAHLGGMNYVNKGIPGGSLTNLGGYGKGQIKNAIMNTTDGKLNADLITLETGPNEGNATPHGTIYDTGDDSYCGCLTQCIQYLQANTNAQIVVIATVATTTPVKDSQVYYERLLLVEQVCKVNHVYFIPTYDGLGTARITANGTKYTVDNIHQSKLGGYNKAHSIWRELKNIPLFYSSTDDLPTL